MPVQDSLGCRRPPRGRLLRLVFFVAVLAAGSRSHAQNSSANYQADVAVIVDTSTSMTQPGMEDKVMHASFRIGETLLMASDGRCDGQPRFEGFSLSIIVADEEKAESVFNALADGGKITMPLAKTFWAPKFGMLEDRFGVGWMVSVQHKA